MTNPLYEKKDLVKVERHTFSVHSIENYWAGGSGGKSEDRPGNFLEQTVQLTACDNPCPVEQLGVQYQVLLYKWKKETTGEPRGYAALKHQQLVELVQQSPEIYTREIQGAVKKKL